MKSVETTTVKIYLGLREGHTDKVHNLDEVKDFLQDYVNKSGLCITISPTSFIYRGGREEGIIIGLINYLRFPTQLKKLEQIAEEIASLCKEKYNPKRVSIEYQDRTIMLE